MDKKEALNEILKLAAKHEVQYWLDAPGTDAEKLAKIVRICRDALDDGPTDPLAGVRLISMRDVPPGELSSASENWNS
jgi:hypothetical protein